MYELEVLLHTVLQFLERECRDICFRQMFLICRIIDALLNDEFHFVGQDFHLRGHVDVERAYEIVKTECADTRMKSRK